ncbi:MAG: glycerol kinase GlpK [Clostridiales bacterium]|nr:glycerol kinase GlpK [Clostridiales bacterium]
MSGYILCIDQGTTSTKAFLLNEEGGLFPGAPVALTQIYPAPGFVEHDPKEIFFSTVKAISNLLGEHPEAQGKIEAIGITNQRETTIAFDSKTGEPLYNAIVWQCRRTADICRREELKIRESEISKKTGLKLDPYFSATKMVWFNETLGLGSRIEDGTVLFGTVDGYLVYKLTGGESFASDYSNCSRTMLFDINTLDYDDGLLELFGVKRHNLAKPLPSSSDFGEVNLSEEELIAAGLDEGQAARVLTLNGIHITGVMGDQPSALFGQNALDRGDAKTTYGTGCFTLMNTGDKPVFSDNGLLCSAAWTIDGITSYALEGSVFQGGSVIKWLIEEMHLIDKPSDCDVVASRAKGGSGVYMIPAFTGLGAPYWDPDARGTIIGLTRGTNADDIVMASIESIIYQVTELVQLMASETASNAPAMKVDGGVCGSDYLMQLQSDMLGIRIVRAKTDEMTAMGAGLMAGLTSGFFADLDKVRSLYASRKEYEPKMPREEVAARMEGYKKAVATAIASKDL